MASSGIAPLLKPVESLNQKWLDRNPLDIVKDECLFNWYNELLAEKEIYIRPESFLNRNGVASHQSSNGHFYCGQNILNCQCCNETCGPLYGCNCNFCKEIEENVKGADKTNNIFLMLDAWAWGELPSQVELQNFAKCVAHRQLEQFKKSTESISLMQRLKARVYVYARFLALYSSTCFIPKQKEENVVCRTSLVADSSSQHHITSEHELEKSGLNLFLKYTFKFLKNAWSKGFGLGVCSEMLDEAVLMFENIDKVLLSENTKHGGTLVDMLNQSIMFLEEILTSEDSSYLPIRDRKSIVVLLFELVFQNASLASFLRVILVCLKLSETGVLEYINLSSYIRKYYKFSTQMDFLPDILKHYNKDALSKESSWNPISCMTDLPGTIMSVTDEEKMSDNIRKLMHILLLSMQPYITEENKECKKCSEDLLVWGNLELLSSLKEEKMSIKIATICCTESSVIVLTLDGKVFWSEHSKETMSLQPYKQVEMLVIIKIACSYAGHFVALTSQKEIFTWHHTANSFDLLCTVPLQLKGEVLEIYAGYSYYAVISNNAELCLWENSLSGRPTHDHHNEQFFPRYSTEFRDDPVIDVAFSQYHNEVILVSKSGRIWSWLNDQLALLFNESLDIIKVHIAKYFYVALSSSGQVWRWGRDHFNKVKTGDTIKLKSVEKLNKQNVLAISTGAYHCVALTDSYNVFCWGGLGGKEEDESSIREPILLKSVSEIGISQIKAGPHQIFCWSTVLTKEIQKKVPFCIDVKKETFEMLEKLLSLTEHHKNKQLKDTLMYSCLSLLKLQFFAAKKFDIAPNELGFDGKSKFAIPLKDLVMQLILDDNTVSCVKSITKQVLEHGWQYLLPNADARAKTLSRFLKIRTVPCKDNHAFMLNLLMNCLKQKNGLERILEDTLDCMVTSHLEDAQFETHLSTMHILLKELFLTSVELSLTWLQNIDGDISYGLINKTLEVILQFQRFLFARIFIISKKDVCWPARCYVYDPTPTIKCLTKILGFYMSLLQTSCKSILTCKLQSTFNCSALMCSPVGFLFHEFIGCMIILQNYAPVIASNCDGLSQLTELLDLYDDFNKSRKEMLSVRANDIDWPAQPGDEAFFQDDYECSSKNNDNKSICMLDETVVGVKGSLPAGNENTLESFVGKEIAHAFDEVFKSNQTKSSMKNAVFGKFTKGSSYNLESLLSLTYDIEVSLSFLLGLHCCYLAHGMLPTQDEINHKRWLSSKLFSSGIERDSVLRDREYSKPAALSVQDLIQKTITTSGQNVIDYLMNQAIKKGIPLIPSKSQVNVALNHAERSILAAMIWHCGLEEELRDIEDYIKKSESCKQANEASDVMSEIMFSIVKMVLKQRTVIFQKHQELQKSYEDICAPINIRCRFLCLCLIPACKTLTQKQSSKWFEAVNLLNAKYKFSWNIQKWGIHSSHSHWRNYDSDDYKIVIQEICDFAMADLNVDVLKKCFLIQIKRTKQRLISGYLMQSLSLRQHLLLSAKYSLLLGWLGLLVPGGSVSHAKPGILYNVELIPKDDEVKLKEVFHGLENFSLKTVFDELEKIIENARSNTSAYKNQIYKSSRHLLLAITILTSSLMSGDIDFLLQCSLLDKLQSMLFCYSELNSSDQMKTAIPFIDERKHKQTHLKEMNGEEMVKLMKIGTQVVRGRDWKWDDQDGPSPGFGRLLGEVAEDGWVRVEWDNGSRNSYRMGKNGKYDLNIADSEDYQGDEDKDDNGHEKKHDNIASSVCQSPISYLSGAVASMTLHSLALVASSKGRFSQSAMSAVKKFLLNTLKDISVNDIPSWGTDIKISSVFGFIRAITVSPQLQCILTDDDWILLVIKMLNLSLLKSKKNANGNSLYVKVQLVRHICYMVKMKTSSTVSPGWKRWLIKSIFKILGKVLGSQSLFTTDVPVSCETVKASMTASVDTTVAEELISMIRQLYNDDMWRDMIDLKMWTSLWTLRIPEKHITMEQKVNLLSTLSIIGGIDSRVRIGGSAVYSPYGQGTVCNILPDGNIMLYFRNKVKPKSCHLSRLDLISDCSFDVQSHLKYYNGIGVYFEMLKIVINGCDVTCKEMPVNGADCNLMVRLHIAMLKCLQEACKNHDFVTRLCSMLMFHERQTFFHIFRNSILSCPMKSIYDIMELQVASVSLAQNFGSSSDDGEQDTEMHSMVKPAQETKKSVSHSQHPNLSQLFSAMGFPTNYVKYALSELGETARPEQIVSWLLEHPSVKNVKNQENNSTIESVQDDNVLPLNVSKLDDDLKEQEMFHLGCIVQCIESYEEITAGSIGTVLKILTESMNILVFWEVLNKTLWITAEKLKIISSTDEKQIGSFEGLKVGMKVKLKAGINDEDHKFPPSLFDDTGEIKHIHQNKYTVTVEFMKHGIWEGNLIDLRCIEQNNRCFSCGESLDGVMTKFKCTQCEHLLLCQTCYAFKNSHKHELKPVEVLSNNEMYPVGRSQNQFIKEILVSSHEHIAARMINQEMDMPWLSEESCQPHWIKLKLFPNVMLSSLTVVLDTTQPSTYPTKFLVYGSGNKTSKSLLNSVVLKKSEKDIVQLLEEVDKIYTCIELQISTDLEKTKQFACKICHLKITGEKRRHTYDQEILDLITSQTKIDSMRVKIDQAKIQEKGFTEQTNVNKQVKVFCWGLNDKDQLGGMRGSKVKSPMLSECLSAHQCQDVVGGSKTLFCVTYDGKVYACGEASCSRLGVGPVDENVSIPRLIDGLSHTIVKKVAVHSGGRHAIALTTTGELYSWGDGEDGKLGHGNKLNYDKPHLIESLVGSFVTDISCGSAHSAAIVSDRDLYTWGLGDYGRLGHGDEITQLKPKWVKGLLGYNVVSVSLGSRDAQTVCLTDDQNVWSWGDGDFGKLGRGGSEGCLTPKLVENLQGVGVCKILCGAQFTLALTTTGSVWTWGKGDFFRLGHNSDAHVREPKCIEALKGKRIVDVAVGALHCLAVTEDGEVYAWGDNDHGQQGTGTTTGNKMPTKILGIEAHRIKRVACGSSHSIAWAEINPTSTILDEPVSFPISRDPLGVNLVLRREHDEESFDNLTKFMREQRPSLVRTTLQMTCESLQQAALQKILESLKIQFSRSVLISCLKIHCNLDNGSTQYDASYSAVQTIITNHITDIVKLLKLSVYDHVSKEHAEVFQRFLTYACNNMTVVCETLVDFCMNELEEKLAYNHVIQEMYKQCVQESSHPYTGAPGVILSGSVKYPGAVMLVVEFSPQCQTEPGHDVLTFYDKKDRTIALRTGSVPSDWTTKLKVSGDEMRWTFITNSPGGLWGFRFTVTPIPPSDHVDIDNLSDEALLSHSSLELVKKLLDCGITKCVRNEITILKLSSLLATCIRIPALSSEERKWMLDYLHGLLLSHNAPPVDVPAILGCSRFRDASVCKLRLDGQQGLKETVLSSTLATFINGIPQALTKQYDYEEAFIRRGDQLMFTSFLRSLALLACSLGLDILPCCSNKHQWAWFLKYCTAIRAAQSFIQRTKLPCNFSQAVRERIQEVLSEDEVLTFDYENNDLFSRSEDEQLLTWLNRRSQDWSVIWGGSGSVYGWGHNHRGQLGGIEGAKIKVPMVCDSLAALKPAQITGGEQTLFCVGSDGKIYATGYGNSSRLGLGIMETVSTPRMIESLQHINIKKVAVHSGGRHCLALSSDGEVFSWGEGDDGKLGHGNRNSCAHPKLIESFGGKNIVDIACGGSHSAAIGEHGELYTWGKGRYGRLGHGDGEDQLRPKIVEALQHFQVLDVACGSGDAQTLCVTSDHSVWSWGDGDYGKLGRGGSDGCKTPMIVEDLNGECVIKVQCGSQFSMALTRRGALYTWGKGDYFRLGHGSEEHVRRPRRVLPLETKVITSICCGSLHCVACTEDGEVYCWGDNDEGQLGDGTTNAGQLPKLCSSLSNKKIDCIACGSAHTIAWSTCESVSHALPIKTPMEYNHLQDISMTTLRNRAFLLHHFSKLFCSCVPLMELTANENESTLLTRDPMVNSLKSLILSSYKENTFRKIIDLSMVRDRQHGPVIELNRVKKHRVDRGLAGPHGSKSVFGQITSKISEFSIESFCLPHRTWKVKFIGESVDDCGGGFSESIAEMCEELQNGSLPLLISSPNSEEKSTGGSDCLILNPDIREETHRKMYRFLGILLGIAIRSGSPLSLSLAEPIWKQLVGLTLNLDDLDDIDHGFVAKHSYLSSLVKANIVGVGDHDQEKSLFEACSKEEAVEALELPFTVRTASWKEVELSRLHTQVTTENKGEYLKKALNYRVHEFDTAIGWIRSGMSQVVPVPFVSLFTGLELENMVCGNPEIRVESLQAITTYRGVEANSLLVKWFWQTLEEFTNHERSLFLRFVWGRTRLPRTAVDFKGKDFIFQVLDKYNPSDDYLPESYTCFFLLKMPRYSNLNILREKLKYAIYFCKSIDSDDYARVDFINT